MNLLQQNHLAENVERGAEFCDLVRPPWFMAIDRSTLDLEDGSHCIAAQVFAPNGWCRSIHVVHSHGLGMDQVGFIASSSPVMHDTWVADQVVLLASMHHQYEFMQKRWLEQIEKRLAHAGLMVEVS